MITKYELQKKVERLRNELQEAEQRLEEMNQAFYIKDKEKPFNKWNINEMESLLKVSEKAYNWLLENDTQTILDYNNSVSTADKVIFER